ncbi:MAG: EboA domain-containing protein [Phycisphaerales bacterium]
MTADHGCRPAHAPDAAASLAPLRRWLNGRLTGDAAVWFNESADALAAGAGERVVYRVTGEVGRRLGQADLSPSADELAEADAARPGWDPSDWSIDQTARVALALATAIGDPAAFHARFDLLCRTADVAEQIAFGRGLALLPKAESWQARAGELVRTNIRPVFESIAHRNPYPAEHFDENAWNQMVLKAVFVDSPLDPIQHLDERANPRLTTMLCRYAGERWAASRIITPELWRCVGRAADDAAIDMLERCGERGRPEDRRAAALAMVDSGRSLPASAEAGLAEELAAARAGAYGWPDLVPAG